MSAGRVFELWSRLLHFLGLRVRDPEATAKAESLRAATRDRARQEWNDGRGPPIIGG